MKKITIILITILFFGCKHYDMHGLEPPKIEFYTISKDADRGYIHYLITTNDDSKYIDWIGYSPIELCYKYLDTLNYGFPVHEIVILSGNEPKKNTESTRDYLWNQDNYIFDIDFENKMYDSTKLSKIRYFDTGKKFNYQSVNFSYYNKIFNDLQ